MVIPVRGSATMSIRSLRLLETALVSTFVSLGVSAVVLVGVVSHEVPTPTPLDPFLAAAVEADVQVESMEQVDELAIDRATALYEAYVGHAEQRAALEDVEWARSRAQRLRQLQADIDEMRKLEAEAWSLHLE